MQTKQKLLNWTMCTPMRDLHGRQFTGARETLYCVEKAAVDQNNKCAGPDIANSFGSTNAKSTDSEKYPAFTKIMEGVSWKANDFSLEIVLIYKARQCILLGS